MSLFQCPLSHYTPKGIGSLFNQHLFPCYMVGLLAMWVLFGIMVTVAMTEAPELLCMAVYNE